MPDPYQILGVARTASAGEIKSAYRKLAKKLHPDVNPGRKDVEQQFKEVTAAYDLLSDSAKRARFDRGEIDGQGQERGFGGGGFNSGFGGARRGPGGQARGGGSGGGAENFGGFSGMEDIFAEFMGGVRGGGRRQNSGGGDPTGGYTNGVRGADINCTLNVGFIEAALGGKKRVVLPQDKTVDITLPPGIEDGHKLRLKGQGEAGAVGNGDAIVEIHIEAHPYFTRKDRDLLIDLPVSLPEAVLGGSVNVPTLDGQVAVKVPKGSSSGATLRLKGKGIAKNGGGHGDMLVRLRIALPEPVPADLAALIEGWSKTHAYDPRAKMGI